MSGTYKVTTPEGVDEFSTDGEPSIEKNHLVFSYYGTLRVAYVPGEWLKCERVGS